MHKQTALETAVAENAAPPTLPEHAALSFRNKVIIRLFKHELSKVKAAVEEYQNGAKVADDGNPDDDKSQSSVSFMMCPAEYTLELHVL